MCLCLKSWALKQTFGPNISKSDFQNNKLLIQPIYLIEWNNCAKFQDICIFQRKVIYRSGFKNEVSRKSRYSYLGWGAFCFFLYSDLISLPIGQMFLVCLLTLCFSDVEKTIFSIKHFFGLRVHFLSR